MSDELANKGWMPADQLPPREETDNWDMDSVGDLEYRYGLPPSSPDLLILGEYRGDLYPFVGAYDYEEESWYLAAYDEKYGPHGSPPADDRLVIRWWRPFPEFWPRPNEDAPNA